MKTLGYFFKGTARNKERVETVARNNRNLFVAGSQLQYYCPMKCEGGKTYNAPGNCPECNMKLVPVHKHENTNSKSHSHNHNHHGCC